MSLRSKKKLKKYVLLGMFGIYSLFAFSAYFADFTNGNKPGSLSILNPFYVFGVFQNNGTAAKVLQILVLILFFGSIAIYMTRSSSLEVGDERGSARWATEEEIEENADFIRYDLNENIKKDGNTFEYINYGSCRMGAGPLVKYDGISITEFLRDKRKTNYGFQSKRLGDSLIDGSNDHVYIRVATGDGKDRRIVNPLIKCIADHGENMIVNDPKKESYYQYKEYLEKERGYRVYCLDYRNPKLSHRFNFLSEVSYYLNTNDPDAAQGLSKDIASTVDDQKNSNEETIWVDGRRATIESLILSICLSPAIDRCKTLFSCYGSLREMGVINHDFKTGLDQGRLIDWYKDSKRTRMEKNAWVPAKLAQDQTKTSFFTNCATSLYFASSEAMGKMMAVSDFSLHDFTDPEGKPIAVFVNVPYEKATDEKMGNIFYDTAFRVFTNDSFKFKDNYLPRRIHMIMNEFTNLPKQNDIDKKLTVARGSNIRYYFLVQSEGQLKEKYGDNITQIFDDNCKVKIDMVAVGHASAKSLSESLGKQTIKTKSTSKKARRGLLDHKDDSNSESLIDRELMGMDEIMYDMKEGDTIVRKSKLRPFFTHLPDMSQISFFKSLTKMSQEDDYNLQREVSELDEYILDQEDLMRDLGLSMKSARVRTPKMKKSELTL